jgi:preprotein translocase subunit YajC
MAVPIIGMGLIFYFIVLRPQKKARKKQEALVESLKKHDRVVTIGGIVGTIISIDTDNEEVVLEVGPDTQLRLLRRSIQGPKPFGSDVDSDSGLS